MQTDRDSDGEDRGPKEFECDNCGAATFEHGPCVECGLEPYEDPDDADADSYLYLIVAGCPNWGEVVQLVEETDYLVDLMQEVPITANCCRHCGGMVHEWDVHEDAEIERVPPTQERAMTDGGERPSDGDGREWTYEVGDLVANNHETPMPGLGGDTDRTESEVKKRLVDTDTGDQFYYIETENGHRVDTMLYSEGVLRLNYEKVGEDDEEQ